MRINKFTLTVVTPGILHDILSCENSDNVAHCEHAEIRSERNFFHKSTSFYSLISNLQWKNLLETRNFTKIPSFKSKRACHHIFSFEKTVLFVKVSLSGCICTKIWVEIHSKIKDLLSLCKALEKVNIREKTNLSRVYGVSFVMWDRWNSAVIVGNAGTENERAKFFCQPSLWWLLSRVEKLKITLKTFIAQQRNRKTRSCKAVCGFLGTQQRQKQQRYLHSQTSLHKQINCAKDVKNGNSAAETTTHALPPICGSSFSFSELLMVPRRKTKWC